MKQHAVPIVVAASLALAFSHEAAAQRIFTASSRSSCRASASTVSDSTSKDVLIDLGVRLGTYICEEGTTGEVLTETVQDVAKAIAATAVAVSASCTGGGWAAAGGTASTSARASATALASAFSSVAACRNCTAGVEWFASATEQAAVESTTTAVVEVDGDASETIVRKNIEEALIPVFVSITTRTRTGYGDGDCRAGVFADFVVGDNALACETIAAAWVEEVSLSGVADAAAATAAYACEEGPIAAGGSKLVAFATAQAFARAVAEANVVCIGSGDLDSCALSRSAIATVVEAQAVAWAEAWATSEGCKCKIDAVDTARSVAKVIVDAAADAFADACVDDNGKAFAQTYTENVAERSVDAVAVAIAQAITKGEDCRATADATVCVGCITEEWERCAGFGIDGVLGCCNPAHVCMQRNWMTAVCVDKGYTPPEWATQLRAVLPRLQHGRRAGARCLPPRMHVTYVNHAWGLGTRALPHS